MCSCVWVSVRARMLNVCEWCICVCVCVCVSVWVGVCTRGMYVCVVLVCLFVCVCVLCSSGCVSVCVSQVD